MPEIGVSFVISPTSFFQVNKSAGEKLYSAVAELAHVDQDTSVVDICCASGGIALTLAKVDYILELYFCVLNSFGIFCSDCIRKPNCSQLALC